MRAFAPPAFGVSKPEFHASIIEARLSHSGEYVRHLPTGEAAQWVVMNYQFIPVDASLSADFTLNATEPQLWGYVEHFVVKPELYREGDSVRPAKGSQFEVRGLIYNVKKVEVNHVGYLHLGLVLADNCATVRPEFATEQAALLCTTAPDCEV